MWTTTVPKARPTGVVEAKTASISSGVALVAMSTSVTARSRARSRTAPPTIQARCPRAARRSAMPRAACSRSQSSEAVEGCRMRLEAYQKAAQNLRQWVVRLQAWKVP
jgi:hypothetical protein